jgi:hypothetical protein
MFIFESGLLATFIPEILMVLAFLLCLATPTLKSDSLAENLPPKVIEFSQNTIYQSNFQHVYVITTLDLVAVNVIKQQAIFVNYGFKTNRQFLPTILLEISDGIDYSNFSRPPPAFIS